MNRMIHWSIVSIIVVFPLFLCFSCNVGRDESRLKEDLDPGAMDLLGPDAHWVGSSASPVPIRLPARTGSPLLSGDWTAGDQNVDGETCVVSTGPSAGIYLPFSPGRVGKVKIRLYVKVMDEKGKLPGDDRHQIAVSFNGQNLANCPATNGWFPLDMLIRASRFHQGDNEIIITVRESKEGISVSTESARLALSGLELTLPRTEAGLMLGRVQQMALVSASPLTIDLPMVLPEGAELRYSVAVMPWFAPAASKAVISRISARALSTNPEVMGHRTGDPSFPVCANEHRVSTELLTTTAKTAGCHWRHHRLPLTELAGEKVRLVLTGETAAGSALRTPLHAWGSMVLTWPVEDEPDVRPYNVIIILADTLRADRLGSGGAAQRLTPHLDRLSRRAVTFQDTVAQASITYPSMSSMFSGDYYTRISRWTQQGSLPPGTPVIGEIFSSNGFHTVGIVSNPLVRPEAGFSRGFHRYDNSLIFKEATRINERFFEWLPMLGNNRFFAYLHYMDVHAPYGSPDIQPPKVFRSGRLKGQRWKDGLAPVVQEFIEHGHCSLDQDDRKLLVEQYNEGIRFWDRQLGCLLAGLERRGVLTNTIVVIIADHGEEFFEHGLVNHGQSVFRELVHVPALILFPPGSGIRQPQQIVEPIELLDIIPTLCDFMGIPLPDKFQGHSQLSPLVQGQASAWGEPVITDRPRLFETRWRDWVKPPFNDTLSGIHHGRWKLIHDRVTGENKLFDLVEDPGEENNLAGDKPDKVEELRWTMGGNFDLFEAGQSSNVLDQREREALEALGYIQ